MTVNELREALEKMPGHWPVHVAVPWHVASTDQLGGWVRRSPSKTTAKTKVSVTCSTAATSGPAIVNRW